MRRALGRRFDVLVSADRHTYAYRDLLAPPVLDLRSDSASTRPGTTRAAWATASARTAASASASATGSASPRPQRFRDYDNLRIGTTVTYGF